jgi:hypothetical protein
MSPRLSSFRKPHGARTVAAALLAMLALVMAASMWEPLHEWLHGETHGTDQECAITLYTDGNCELSFADEPDCAALSVTVWEIPELCDTWVPNVFLSACVWEHAPPRES